MSDDRNMKAEKSKLETGMKIEMVLNVALGRKEEDPHNFLGAFEVVKNPLEIRGAEQTFSFPVVIHSRSAGKNRIFAPG